MRYIWFAIGFLLVPSMVLGFSYTGSNYRYYFGDVYISSTEVLSDQVVRMPLTGGSCVSPDYPTPRLTGGNIVFRPGEVSTSCPNGVIREELGHGDRETLCGLSTYGYPEACAAYDAAMNPEPSHCSNGVKDEDETGIDCGGSCSADCEAICPSNTEYLTGFDGEPGCYWYGTKDSLGNCPAGTYASDEFGVIGCYKEYSPILVVAGTEVPDVADMSFQGGSVSTVSQVYPSTTTDNGDGTSTRTTVSETTGSDGRSTTETKIEIINNSTQQIISSETTKTEETPPEENAGNYDYDIGSGELAEPDYSDVPEEKSLDTLFDSVQTWNPFANLDDEMAIETSNAACEFGCDLDLGMLGSHKLAFGLCEYDWAFNAIGVVLNFVAVGSAVYIVVRR